MKTSTFISNLKKVITAQSPKAKTQSVPCRCGGCSERQKRQGKTENTSSK